MFYGSREECLAVLRLVGRESCLYGGPWPDNICDCKYGVKGRPMFDPPLPQRENEQVRDRRPAWSEQNGCPEIRSIYRVVEKMTDEEWNEFASR